MGQPNWQGYGQGQQYGYAQRPPPRKSNTIWWVLGIVGGGFVLLLLIIAGIAGSPEAKAKRAAAEASASARVAAAETSAKAKAAADDAALHKACKVPTSKPLEAIDPSSFKVQCRDIVRDRLKAPSTAEFPGIFDGDSRPVSIDGCRTVYSSYVDAQNAFGAKLRTKYVCTYDPTTGLINVAM